MPLQLCNSLTGDQGERERERERVPSFSGLNFVDPHAAEGQLQQINSYLTAWLINAIND